MVFWCTVGEDVNGGIVHRDFDCPISKELLIEVWAVDRPIGLLVISQEDGNRPIECIQPFKVQHRVPLTQKMTQRASRRGISYVC